MTQSYLHQVGIVYWRIRASPGITDIMTRTGLSVAVYPVLMCSATGVPPPRVAERAGHSVEVLLRVYAKCLDDGEDIANTRIDAALRDA